MMRSIVEMESRAMDMPRARLVKPKASKPSTAAAQKECSQDPCRLQCESRSTLSKHPHHHHMRAKIGLPVVGIRATR